MLQGIGVCSPGLLKEILHMSDTSAQTFSHSFTRLAVYKYLKPLPLPVDGSVGSVLLNYASKVIGVHRKHKLQPARTLCVACRRPIGGDTTRKILMVARRKSSRTAGSVDVMKDGILSLLEAAAAAAAVVGFLPRTRRLMEPTRRRHSWGSCDVAAR
jgi:hypothetical protein